MMRVFVFTYDRWDKITTSLELEKCGVAHTVLCHGVLEYERFINAGRVRPERLHVTGQPKGLAYNRNYALDMMRPGEWAVFLVDDWIKATELDTYDTFEATQLAFSKPPRTSETAYWRKRLLTPLSIGRFIERCQASAQQAEKHGAALVGFAGNNNPLHRVKKISNWCLADGRAWVVRKTDLRFDNKAQLIDDYCFTALNLIKFGKVWVENWILPECSRYTAGSYGSMEHRIAQKITECKYLVQAYPEVIEMRDKIGWPKNSHVRIIPLANAGKFYGKKKRTP